MGLLTGGLDGVGVLVGVSGIVGVALLRRRNSLNAVRFGASCTLGEVRVCVRAACNKMRACARACALGAGWRALGTRAGL